MVPFQSKDRREVTELLTPKEVALACRVSEKTVYRAIATEELRAARLGDRGAYRIRPEWVEDWVENRAGKRAPPARRAAPPRARGHRSKGSLVVMPEMGR